jgi:hypothetical protein
MEKETILKNSKVKIVKNYGTIYKRCREPKCRRRNLLLSLNNFYSHKGGRFGKRAICKECYHIRYGAKIEEYKNRRQNHLKSLPNNLTLEQEQQIRLTFDNRCALSGKKENVSLDHFVPLSWGSISHKFGIGGNTYENMLPLNIYLNKSKSSHNPFEWIKDASIKHDIEVQKWNEAVRYIAEKHQISPIDFENRVNQCHLYILARSIVFRLNKVIALPRRNPPLNMLRWMLAKGINTNVAIEKFGNKRVKEFIKNDNTVSYIANVKKELELESLKKEI